MKAFCQKVCCPVRKHVKPGSMVVCKAFTDESEAHDLQQTILFSFFFFSNTVTILVLQLQFGLVWYAILGKVQLIKLLYLGLGTKNRCFLHIKTIWLCS